MKKLFLMITVAISLLAVESMAREVYYAKISENDKYNSYGDRLNSVADILRQDRANYHRFGLRDRDDSGDGFFAYKGNRARLASMLRRGYISPSTRNAILYRNPVVRVTIYEYHIDVELY